MKFQLEALPPFRLDLTVWALRRRPDNVWDQWDGETYRRVICTPEGPADIAVVQAGTPTSPQVEVTTENGRATGKETIAAAVNCLLGLQINLTPFYALAANDNHLNALAQRFMGFKPPRFLSVFEALTNGIVCQQITLTLGIRFLNRLVQEYGVCVDTSNGAKHAFPQPTDLINARPETLKTMGFSRQKGFALLTLADEIVAGRREIETFACLDDESALRQLLLIHGVGRWTAEYAQLRGLGRLHVFPADDVGGRKNLRSWLQQTEPTDYETTHRILAQWKPYAGMIYFHLLLGRLAHDGHFLT